MTADLASSAYLVDGVDLGATGVVLDHDGSGLWSGLTEDVGVDTFPGKNGGIIVGGTFKPYTHSTMYQVKANGYTAVWAAIRALRRRCKPGRTVTLTRLMPDPEGTDTNVSLTTTGRRVSDRPAWLTPNFAKLDIDWEIVGGPWLGPSATVAGPGDVTVKGDVPTRKMIVTLDAGAARTVTNTTNGFWFTFGTTVPAGGIVVDVAARTAKAVTGGADYSGYLSWGKAAPMQLEPGANTLTVSSGGASISYQPGYL